MTERKRPESGVQTGGGAHIAGEVHVGSDFVGRDKRTTLGPGGTLVEGDVSGHNVSLGPGSAGARQGASIQPAARPRAGSGRVACGGASLSP
jgi:hypothetical protein